MNYLYASHIHKDYSIYHAFMHTVKFLWVAQIAGTSYSAAKSLSMEEQIYLYLELILDVSSFYVYKAEVMYRFK